MAYLRYGPDCDWYVFWQSSDVRRKEAELAAVWHVDHRAKGPTFSYATVRKMLAQGDFSAIPGYAAKYEEQLREALMKFLANVDETYHASPRI